MKKIGIITHYYNSNNYGGLLQAFALTKIMNDYGVKAEQIQYDISKKKRNIFKKLLRLIKKKYNNFKEPKIVKKRKKNCTIFRNRIPHSKRVYWCGNIKMANKDYSAFIVGSDQVWHPNVFNVAYSLKFSTKPSFSYAASVASDCIPEELIKEYEQTITLLKKVSVRERQAIQILSFVKNVKLVLDPVFLLDSKEWESLSSKRIVNNKYIFCYFLGDCDFLDTNLQELSKKTGFDIIRIYGNYINDSKCSSYFGSSPNDFLSLILHSELVLTDSFHAVCFSYIFKKNFYVFKRKGGECMNNRIIDILKTLNCEERLADYVDEIARIDYENKNNKIFKDLLIDSKKYIYDLIGLIKYEKSS